ncbi:MAG: NAD(P)/FAD-dependent oxidoreductase [Spirulinaceae cyanobacterium]
MLDTNRITNSTSPTKICILGGGFGGLYTALYLQSFKGINSSQYQVTLVDQNDHLLFTPLLYEVITDELQTWEIAPAYKKLLSHTKVRIIQDRVVDLDLKTHLVKLLQGQLTYDYLVLALGNKNRFAGVVGAKEHSLTFRSLKDTLLLKEKLVELSKSAQETIRVAIIGGGPSGVELGTKIADFLGRRADIRLIERGTQILKAYTPATQRSGKEALEKRGVRISFETSVEKVEPNQVTLIQKEETFTIPVDLVLWSTGTKTQELIANLSCQHNERGQVITLPTLQIPEYPEVLALGDLAEVKNPNGKLVPATAQAAYQQASQAAKNLKASFKNKPLKRFRYLHLGEMITLGINDAAVSSFGINLKGSLAALVRRIVYLQRLPTFSHRWEVLKGWLGLSNK